MAFAWFVFITLLFTKHPLFSIHTFFYLCVIFFIKETVLRMCVVNFFTEKSFYAYFVNAFSFIALLGVSFALLGFIHKSYYAMNSELFVSDLLSSLTIIAVAIVIYYSGGFLIHRQNRELNAESESSQVDSEHSINNPTTRFFAPIIISVLAVFILAEIDKGLSI